MHTVIYSVAAMLVLTYAVALFLLWRFQERIVFQPPRFGSKTGASAERVSYTASDGTPLFAYVIGRQGPAAPVLLAFHGNADLARWLIPWAAAVSRETGACVVLPEYRGYDGIPGEPTYAGVACDAMGALSFVRDTLRAPRERTFYFGHSLGTAVAAELAAEEEPRALLLQSPFTSARAMARRMIVPGVGGLWRVLSRVHYDTIERVGTLSAPVWVAHGDRDLVVPVRMGRDVFAAAAAAGELLIVRGAGHADVDEIGGGQYWGWLRRACSPRELPDHSLSA